MHSSKSICALLLLFTPVMQTGCKTGDAGNSGTRDSAAAPTVLPVMLGVDSATGSELFISTLTQSGYTIVEACANKLDACKAAGPWNATRATAKPGIFALSELVQPSTARVFTFRALKAPNDNATALFQAITFASRATQAGTTISGGSCQTLKDRIVRKAFTVAAPIKTGAEASYRGTGNLERDWYNGAELLPIVTSVAPTGQILVGWMDGSNVNISTFSGDLSASTAANVTFKASRLRDIQADKDGFAVLALESEGGTQRMAIRRFEAGQEKWRTPLIVRDNSSTLHMGRIARYDDGSYAAYFGIHGGGHEADALLFLDASGKRKSQQGSWEWGCSHSMDERLAIVGGKELPVCIGDNYPAAIALRTKTIVPEVQQYNGLGSGTLGGMVHFKNHMIVIESTKTGRSGRDIALVAFESSGANTSKGRIWLTETANINEVKPKIALYGSKLLVMWKNAAEASGAPEVYTMKVLDLEFSASTFAAKVIRAEDNVPFEIGSMEDLATNAQGDVLAGARTPGAATQLQVQVIKACGE